MNMYRFSYIVVVLIFQASRDNIIISARDSSIELIYWFFFCPLYRRS